MNSHDQNSNKNSHVNRILGVSLDDAGFITTKYGTYHPVTGEGSSINMPRELKQQILVALLKDGEDSGPAEEFDWDKFTARKSGCQN